ncbi:MAG: OmpA family protein [Gilvibacter sp.]
MKNHFLKIAVLVSVYLLSSTLVFSQRNQLVKADKKFDNYGYIDARLIYLEVLEEGFESAELYEKIGDTYYWNAEYAEASQYYSQLLEKYPDQIENIEVYYRAAQSLKSQGQYDEAEALIEQYIAAGGVFVSPERVIPNEELLREIGVHLKRYEIEKIAVNTELSDFGPGFFGDKLVYASTTQDLEAAKTHKWNNQPYLDLFVADINDDGSISNPKALNEEINSLYHESSAILTADGKTMYFTRNNFLAGKKGKDDQNNMRLKVYKATRSGNGRFTNVQELPFNNDDYSVAHPALSKDGTKLFFSSDMPGTLGYSDLWYVDILGENSYSEPKNLGKKINTSQRESFAFISEEGNLYFSSSGHGGSGGLDIFLVPDFEVDQENYSIATFGEPINSGNDDFGFIIKESEGRGYFSSNKDGGQGSADDEIYFFQEKCEITVNGIVTDLNTKEILPGALVTLIDSNANIVDTYTANDNGAYEFVVECDSMYTIRGTKEDYNPSEKTLETPYETAMVQLDLQLEPVDPCGNDLGCILDLQPIYFDLDRYNIRADAQVELAKVFAAMRRYPELVIHIESHTDSRADDRYNEILSERRAQSTLNWLVERGIDASRLTAKGYGEYQLVNDCSNDVDCTEELHQLNRRSMFIIQPLDKAE